MSAASMPGLSAPLVGRRAVQRLVARCPRRVAALAYVALAVFIALRPLITAARCCH